MSSTASGRETEILIARRLTAFQAPSVARSVWQIVNSFALFIGTSVAMYIAYDHGFWPALVLVPIAAGALVRIFIIQHDCGHGAFFASHRANVWVGRLCSLATLTPFANWRRQHAGHHANWNNLDRRESGTDIYSKCLTLAEYRALTPWRRWLYRLARHPLMLYGLLPPLVFTLLYRLPFDTPRNWRRERRSVLATDAVLVAALLSLGFAVGWPALAAVQLPVIALAASIGAWLFAVQHVFVGTRWFRGNDWTLTDAALRGTSHLRLPRVLQWFSGNIGVHHIHHLNPRIPNYRLTACANANPDLAGVELTLWAALKGSGVKLWNEEQKTMEPIQHDTAGGNRPAGEAR